MHAASNTFHRGIAGSSGAGRVAVGRSGHWLEHIQTQTIDTVHGVFLVISKKVIYAYRACGL